jgi:predicted aspartyl protease
VFRLARLLIFLFFAVTIAAFGQEPSRTSSEGSLKAFLSSHGFGGAALQRRFGNHLFLPTTINGKRAALMVDTGAPMTIIDKNSIGSLGLRPKKTDARVGGVWGMSSERYARSELQTVVLGNCTLINVPVAVSDQSGMNYYNKLSHLDGLLGAREMYKFGVVIDCARQNLYLNPNGPNRDISQKLGQFLVARGFTHIPMRINSHRHFEVDGAINGHPAGFIVDTGSGTTLLAKEQAVAAGVLPGPLPLASEGADGRVERLNSGEVKELSIGTFKVSNAEVTLGRVSPAVLSGSNIGLLGEEYLSWNFGVIDISGLSLYLRHPDRR